MEQLNVKIGADIKDLEAKLSQAIRRLDNLKLAQKGLKKAFDEGKMSADKYYDALAKNSIKIQNAGSNVNKFKSQLGNIVPQMDGVGKATANAIPTLTSFSQVIQDAPYGIRGVANNITQLTSQFGYLSKATGGAGAALKSMLGSLAGPAGILFAVSAVTSLLVTYGDEISNWIKGNDALAASQKKVNEALNEFYGDQVTKINSYVSILEDVNTNEKERKNVIDELIKTVPTLKKADFEYGQNLDIVKGKIGEYVLAQAARIEADTLVQENAEKLAQRAKIESIKNIQDEKKRLEEITKFIKEKGLDKKITSAVTLGIGDIDTSSITAAADKTEEEIVKSFNRIADEVEKDTQPIQDRISELYGITFGDPNVDGNINNKLKTKFEQLKAELSEVTKKLEDSILTKGRDAEETIKLATEYKRLKTQVEAVATAIDNLSAEKKPIVSTIIDPNLVKSGLKEIDTAFEKVNGKKVEIKIGEIKTPKIRPFADQDYIKSLYELQKTIDSLGLDPSKFNLKGLDFSQLDNLNDKLQTIQITADIFGSAIGSAFNQLASSIGEALSTGNKFIDAFIGSILQSLAQLLTQLLVQQVTQAAATTAIQAATASASMASALAQSAAAGVVAQSQGVQIATSAAAALGPFGFAALPGLLTATFTQIQAALTAAQTLALFDTGGFTGKGRKRDSTGHRVAGIVHENEYVVPTKVLKTEEGKMLVSRLESIRTNNIRTFATGGFTTSYLNNITQNNSLSNNVSSFATGGFTTSYLKNITENNSLLRDVDTFSFKNNINNYQFQNNFRPRDRETEIIGEVMLRGTDQIIQLRRSEKRMKRFYSN